MAYTGSVLYTNYKKITVLAASEDWAVYAYDYNGKAISSLTIEVDTTAGKATITLADIVGYSFVGTKITIVALTGATNKVSIVPMGSDTFGSLSAFDLNTDGANVILTPVNNTDWSATISL